MEKILNQEQIDALFRAARNHALSLRAREASLVACGEFLWMCMVGPRQEGNLVFKLTPTLS